MASSLSLSIETKPSNARYIAKLRATPEGDVRLVPGDAMGSEYGEIEIAWYSDGVKFTIPNEAPACVTQAYLTGSGRDVIIEIKPLAQVGHGAS